MPAAVTSWVVTAAGILWPIGNIVGTLCAAGSVSGALLWRAGAAAAPDADDRHRLGRRGRRRCGFRVRDRVARQRSRSPPDRRDIWHQRGGGRHAHRKRRTSRPRTAAVPRRAASTGERRDLWPGSRFRARARLRRGDGRPADAVSRQNDRAHPSRPDGGRDHRDRYADHGPRRAGASGCVRGPRGVRGHGSSRAARRPGGDAAGASPWRHVHRQPRDRARIPHGRSDAPHRGVRG